MKKILALILATAMLSSFVGCTITIGNLSSTQNTTIQMPTSQTITTQNTTTQTTTQSTTVQTTTTQTTQSLAPAVAFNTTRYTATPRDEQLNPEFDEMYSFKDDEYYYYIFYLGSLHNVPLQDISEVEIYDYFGDDYSLTLKSTESDTSSISEMVSVAERTCVSSQVQVSGKIGTNKDSKIQLEAGVARTVSSSRTLSETQSYTQAASFTTSKTRELQVHFNQNYAQGHYRFILLGELDVFGVIIKNIQTGECFSDIYNVIVTQTCRLDYSSSPRFNDTKIEKLIFDLSQSEIDNLPIPQIDIEKAKGPDLTKTVTYHSGYERKKIDASYTYRYDTFDISALSEFMNSAYTLEFEIDVMMKEENAGIQEIYLINDKDQRVAGNGSIEYGGSGKPKDTWGWEHFSWSANGKDCTNKMHLEYGAHGENSDDWWRAEVNIVVTVSQN